MQTRHLVAHSLFLASALVLGCPGSRPDAIGEGEGEGEGDEGEGEGEGEVVETGALLVEGTGLHLEDVSSDGTELAFRDADDTVFTVSPVGGSPSQVAINTDRARYHGASLVLLHGDIDGTGAVYASADRRPAGAAPSPMGTNVKTGSLEASPDGEHLYFESQLGEGLEDLYLDGVRIVQGASKEKVRFSPASDFLVVGANLPDTVNGGSIKFVASYPLAGGPSFVLAADGASNETQVSRDGARVVFGANEDANLVDITVVPIAGGASTIVKAGGDDVAFKVARADDEIIYLTNTVTTGGIEAVAFDGSGTRTILASGAVDLLSISSTHLVYASSLDVDTGLPALRIIGLDGEGDASLGAGAVDEGFSEDERFYVWRDGVAGDLGTLRAFDVDTGTTTTVASAVTKVSRAAGATIVYATSSFDLGEAVLPNAGTVIARDVDRFVLVPPALGAAEDRVAYSKETGIYLRPL